MREYLKVRLGILKKAWRTSVYLAGNPKDVFLKAFRVLSKEGLPGVKRVVLELGKPSNKTRYRLETPGSRDEYFWSIFKAANRVEDGYVPLTRTADLKTRLKTIAFYLPQFHPIDENDAWWGKGFTEWTNVGKALPQFVGHYQPRLPGELGYYDLRVKDVMKRQVELAKLFGIHAFCFYYYWFSGKKLLDLPLKQFVDGDFKFPFCICWANENWTRRWDGKNNDILAEQLYLEKDPEDFIQEIIPIISKPSYLKIEGRPIVLVYRVDELPDARQTAAIWRRKCEEAGLGNPYLIAVLSFEITDPSIFGFDAGVEFPPHKMRLPLLNSDVDIVNRDYKGLIYDYQDAAEWACKQHYDLSVPVYRGVMPSWDNESRKPGRGTVFHGATPTDYAAWFAHLCSETDAKFKGDDKFIFINAWNEWAEGANLEPDRRFGYAYLDATARVLESFKADFRKKILVVSHDALFHGAQLLALNIAKVFKEDYGFEVHLLLLGGGPLKGDFGLVSVVHDLSGYSTEDISHELDYLVSLGIDAAICNTSVVGHIVQQLSDRGVKCLSLIHEMPGLIAKYKLEKSIKEIANAAQKVIFPTAYVKDAFLGIQHVSADKQLVMPQGLYRTSDFLEDRFVVRTEIREELDLFENTKIVLGVGFADLRKGIDYFAAVSLLMAKKLGNVKFVWIGDRNENEIAGLEGLVEKAISAGVLLMPGAKKSAAKFYAAADAYFLSSREDPFPSVVLEALDAGLPVVAFEGSGGAVELLGEGWGSIVGMGDVQSATNALHNQLLRTQPEVMKFSDLARKHIQRKYDFKSYVYLLAKLLGVARKKVSVIVPNYNYAPYIEERLRGILCQTVLPAEIIVLDDASNDDSVAIAERVLNDSPVSWKIIKNEKNTGCYPQWIKGIEAASNDFIWIAEADDLSEEGFLANLLPFFENRDVVMAYCESRQIDENGTEIAGNYADYLSDFGTDKWNEQYINDGLDEIRKFLVIKNTIPNASAVLFRKESIPEAVGTVRQLKNAGDWFFYANLLKTGCVAYTPKVLNSHRRHSRSLTIGDGGLRLMREILMVQNYIRQCVLNDTDVPVERIDVSNQKTYQYLNLDEGTGRYWMDDVRLQVDFSSLQSQEDHSDVLAG